MSSKELCTISKECFERICMASVEILKASYRFWGGLWGGLRAEWPLKGTKRRQRLKGSMKPLRGFDRTLRKSERLLNGTERPLNGSEKPLNGSDKPLNGLINLLSGLRNLWAGRRGLLEVWEFWSSSLRDFWEVSEKVWEAESLCKAWRGLRGFLEGLRGPHVKFSLFSVHRIFCGNHYFKHLKYHGKLPVPKKKI